MNHTLLWIALIVLCSGCRKPLPSPDFTEASNRCTNLLALQGDDAYSSTAMDEVVSQLGRVPEKSADSKAAVALIATIAAEKARIASDAAKLAAAPPAAEPTFPSFAPVAVEPVVESTPDAAANELARGADFAALQRKYVGCLLSKGDITMISPDGGASPSEGFELHDSASCRSRLSLGSNLVVVQAGKIAHVITKDSLKTVITLEDGGKPSTP